jgi:hypothetical protein
VRDRPGPVVQGIREGHHADVGARRTDREIRGHAHVQGLVRPLLIKQRQEVVEPRLLLERIGGGRRGRLAFERQMHALVAPTVWSAYRQLQTYKSELPTLFAFNCVLVVSDGVEAWVATLVVVDADGVRPS